MIVDVDGRRIELFTSFDLHTSIADISDVFVFTTSLLDILKVNSEIIVSLDNETPILSGKIDMISPSGNNGKWKVRSSTSALIDSCPIDSTGEFRNRTAKQIITALAAPFGIEVEGEKGVLFDKFNVEQDATCSKAISELCVFSGMIATATPSGVLFLHKYENKTHESVMILQDGINCNMQLVVNSTKTANLYKVVSQGSFLNGNLTDLSSSQEGIYTTPKQTTIISDIASTKSNISKQSDWLRRWGDASVEILKVKIPSIHTITKGSHVTVNSLGNKIENGSRLVEQVRYVLEQGKTPYTELVLVPPFKYGGEEVELSGWLL